MVAMPISNGPQNRTMADERAVMKYLAPTLLLLFLAAPAWGQTPFTDIVTVCITPDLHFSKPPCLTDLDRAHAICDAHPRPQCFVDPKTGYGTCPAIYIQPGSVGSYEGDFGESCVKIQSEWHKQNDDRIAKDIATQKAADLSFINKVAEGVK